MLRRASSSATAPLIPTSTYQWSSSPSSCAEEVDRIAPARGGQRRSGPASARRPRASQSSPGIRRPPRGTFATAPDRDPEGRHERQATPRRSGTACAAPDAAEPMHVARRPRRLIRGPSPPGRSAHRASRDRASSPPSARSTSAGRPRARRRRGLASARIAVTSASVQRPRPRPARRAHSSSLKRQAPSGSITMSSSWSWVSMPRRGAPERRLKVDVPAVGAHRSGPCQKSQTACASPGRWSWRTPWPAPALLAVPRVVAAGPVAVGVRELRALRDVERQQRAGVLDDDRSLPEPCARPRHSSRLTIRSPGCQRLSMPQPL